MSQNENEQTTSAASTTETLLPMATVSSSETTSCCDKIWGYTLYTLLGIFLITLGLALILGGGSTGLIPVISRTGAFICFGISMTSAAILLLLCLIWMCFNQETD